MKTQEELNEIRKIVEDLNRKLEDLNEEELVQVCGGLAPGRKYWPYNGTGKQGDKL